LDAGIIIEIRRAVALLLAFAAVSGVADDDFPDNAELDAQGAVIGTIVLHKADVFDLSNPEENNWLYRWANRLHIMTRDGVIHKQLLFESGDTYSQQLVEETERILRRNVYLDEANIRPVRYENGVVDLEVATHDLWSLDPEVSLTRSGGENTSRIGLEEANLLGRGQTVRLVREEDVDRRATIFTFSDRHLGTDWVSATLHVADNSDGHSYLVSLARPFYALDTRWATGMRVLDDDRVEALYELGNEAAEFNKEQEYYTAWGGWSRGLRKGRTHRWTAGVVYDNNVFSEVPDATLPPAIPENRRLVYPFIGFEMVQDDFVTATNRNQIDLTEDFLMGTQLHASLGWSDEAFGADRDALIYFGEISQGFGSIQKTSLQVLGRLSGRIESGDAVNSIVALDARFYHNQSEKRLFYAAMHGAVGHKPDLDHPIEIGGDSGLRGYPLRYQSGDSRLVFTVEQRYFTDWYPFRLVRVGGAIFADAGRVWGDNPLGGAPLGWLKDVGFGLRFALTRSASRKVIHLDFAFPLDGDPTIDDFQILLESRHSF